MNKFSIIQTILEMQKTKMRTKNSNYFLKSKRKQNKIGF
jgi:hypothetical protein